MKFLFLIITIKKPSLSITINVNEIKRKRSFYIFCYWPVAIAKPEFILFLLKKNRKYSGYQLLQNKPPQI